MRRENMLRFWVPWALTSAGTGMTVAYLPLRAQHLGHRSPGFLTVAMAALALSSVVSSSSVGRLIRWVSPVHVFSAAGVLRIAGYLAYGFAGGRVTGVLALTLLGLGNGLLLASLPLVVGSLGRAEDRPARLAAMNALFNAGVGLGALATATLIVVARQHSYDTSIYFVAAALSALLPLSCLRMTPDPLAPAAEEGVRRQWAPTRVL
jgi:predicted MFS family arabinose efflux permease